MELVGKNPLINAGDIRDSGSIPGLGRSSGEGHGDPPQYSYLENPMDSEAWQFTVNRAAKSQTWLKQLSTHPPKYKIFSRGHIKVNWVGESLLFMVCVCVCVFFFFKFFIWVWKLGNCFYIKIYFLLTTLIVAVLKWHLLACSKLYPSPTLEQKEKNTLTLDVKCVTKTFKDIKFLI